MHVVAPEERSILDALALGTSLLDAARAMRAPCAAASVVRGPAVLLGARQHAARVLALEACARAGVAVYRRATAGTAAYVGAGRGALVFALALPHVAALAPDAQPHTLLNRNVRGFLQGFTRAGALAHYFGREWIAVRHRPAALLGFTAARDGAVLIELIAGLESSIALPAELATARERATDRWRGHAPIALDEVLPRDRAPLATARTVLEACAARWQHAVEPLDAPPRPGSSGDLDDAPRAVLAPDDPLPAGATARDPVECPIGWTDVAAVRAADGAVTRVWLGGDVIAPGWYLDDLAAAARAGDAAAGARVMGLHVPVEGARVEALLATAAGAWGVAGDLGGG